MLVRSTVSILYIVVSLNTPTKMRSTEKLLLILLTLYRLSISRAESYECAIERFGSNGEEYCVFHNVHIFKNTTESSFSSPPGIEIPSRVAFKNSSMAHLPAEFLQHFGKELKVLKVEHCQLRSITVTSNMQALYAKDNYISKVIVHQSGQSPILTELDLSANRLESIQNITRCQKLQVLNLSSNEKIAKESVIDLSSYAGFQELRELYLADVGAFYLDNTKGIGLPSLELLDLSKNNLIPSDLRLEHLYEFNALQTLKFNDNNMAQLDYGQLPDLKALKKVYINGNNFPCSTLKVMLQFLHEHNIETPPERNSNCQSHQQEVENMCCKYVPSPPIYPKPTERPSTATSTVPNGAEDPRIDQRPAADGEGGNGFLWGIIAIGIVAVIAAAVAGYFVYRKRSRRH
ncbi:leucine-rich repeat-containing G-protein coupled receptor 5-like [Topomyia yanbarensis]|uniref:leucine-rich repeat-containing G-protein coupled receptor 5-like n=1 Tax=Topomyia yanbarensis TaxID=2498891 RepID=UPI00273AE8BA|nr:leucine-rich repeat-containing G-protein coupled receptor 5-like [Topomyia yanbarensis]